MNGGHVLDAGVHTCNVALLSDLYASAVRGAHSPSRKWTCARSSARRQWISGRVQRVRISAKHAKDRITARAKGCAESVWQRQPELDDTEPMIPTHTEGVGVAVALRWLPLAATSAGTSDEGGLEQGRRESVCYVPCPYRCMWHSMPLEMEMETNPHTDGSIAVALPCSASQHRPSHMYLTMMPQTTLLSPTRMARRVTMAA